MLGEPARPLGERADSLAGQRLADMRDFYDHVLRELPAVIERWRAGRKEGA